MVFDEQIDPQLVRPSDEVLIPLDDGTFIVPTVDVVNDQFLVRDPNRLTDWVDDGSGGSLEDYYSSWSYSYYGSGGDVRIGDTYTSVKYKAESNDISIKI